MTALRVVHAPSRSSVPADARSAARAHAFLQGRSYATPHDVKTLAPDVLRHRIMTTYEAEAEGKTSDELLGQILDGVLVP